MIPKTQDEKDRMIAGAANSSVPGAPAAGLDWREFFERLGSGTLPSKRSSKAIPKAPCRTGPSRIERAKLAAETTTSVAKALTEEETEARREKSDRLRAARFARDAADSPSNPEGGSSKTFIWNREA